MNIYDMCCSKQSPNVIFLHKYHSFSLKRKTKGGIKHDVEIPSCEGVAIRHYGHHLCYLELRWVMASVEYNVEELNME